MLFTAANSESINFGDVLNYERTQPMSWCFWFKTVSTGIMEFMTKMDASSNYRGVAINITNGTVKFVFNNNSANNSIQTSHGVNYNDGVLRHIVIAYNGDSIAGNIKVYKSGEQINTSVDRNDLSATVLTSVDLSIASLTNTLYFFNGNMYDFRWYTRVISLEESKIMFESRGRDNITNGLVWRILMNELPTGSNASDANSIIDISGSGYHGSPQNTPVYDEFQYSLVR